MSDVTSVSVSSSVRAEAGSSLRWRLALNELHQPFVRQLPSRDVDRQSDQKPVAAPCGCLGAGFREDVFGHLPDESHLIGDTDELLSRNPSLFGVLPACQRFDSEDLAR